MTNTTRHLIRNFAETYLKSEVFKGSSDNHFPVDISHIVRTLKGVIIEDIDDLAFDGWIKYISNSSTSFEIHIRKMLPENRKRFTLAHELGHLFLHMDFFDAEKQKEHGEYKDCIFYRKEGNYAEEELQANEFAASLLMPSEAFFKKAAEHIIDAGRSYDVVAIAIILVYHI